MQEKLSSIDFSSVDTWDKITSFIGFIITIVTLCVADNARKAINRVQNSITFDKRIPNHLKNIDLMLSDYNSLLNNQTENINEINTLLGSISSELDSLELKLTNNKVKRSISEARNQIKTIHSRTYTSAQNHNIIERIKIFFKGESLSISNIIQMSYIKIGEIYTSVSNIHKDAKTRISK